jgi:hypothetical protein
MWKISAESPELRVFYFIPSYPISSLGGGEVKLSLKQAVEAHRVVRCRGSHIF